jgi:hypothetical protein
MAFLKTLAQWLLLPLIKDFIKLIYAKITLYLARKAHTKKIEEKVNEAVNEQDQRPIEQIVSPEIVGKPTGRGVIVDSLPGVREPQGTKRSDMAE